jgi:hypothetical protein
MKVTRRHPGDVASRALQIVDRRAELFPDGVVE